MESSPAEATPAGGADPATHSDVQPADSSTGTEAGVKTEGSVVDAVSAALRKPQGEESPPSQTQGSPEADGSDPAKDGKADKAPSEEDISDEEIKSLKPKTARAIERFRTQVSGLKQEVETLAPKAREFDKLTGFFQRSNLSPEDVNSGMEIMALMKQNPVAAYEKLAPIVQQLQQLAGEVLPAELQERVRLGYISEQDARDLHRAKTRETVARNQAKQVEERTHQEREQERVQAVVRDVTTTVTEWERQKKSSDPDWNLKAARIDELVRLRVYEQGYPDSKDAALAMVEKIYETVTKEVRKFAPKPQERQHVNGGSSSQVVAEPKSLLDAIRIGMNR